VYVPLVFVRCLSPKQYIGWSQNHKVWWQAHMHIGMHVVSLQDSTGPSRPRSGSDERQQRPCHRAAPQRQR
jgi:hypothetical protein